MNSQSIANLQGKLINVSFSNGTSKKGVLEAVHDEYFILKNEVEAKAREIVYYDGVIKVYQPYEVNWDSLLNQKVFFTFKTGSFRSGIIQSINKDKFSVNCKGNLISYDKSDLESIKTVSFVAGDKLTLQNNIPATVETVDNDKVWVSLCSSDLFTLTINKEEVKSEERSNLQGCMIGEKKCETNNLINSYLIDATLTLTKEKLKLMCYFDEFNQLNNIYNYVLVNANKLKILYPNKLDTFIKRETEVVISLTHNITFKCLFNMVYKRGGNKYYSLMFRKDESTLEVLNTTSVQHDTILIVDDIEKKEENNHNLEAIKKFVNKILALPDFSKNIPAYMYQGFLEIQKDDICKNKVFPVFKESYEKIREYISSKLIKGHSIIFLKDRADFLYGWTKAYNEYSIDINSKEQIEISTDLLKKLERILGSAITLKDRADFLYGKARNEYSIDVNSKEQIKHPDLKKFEKVLGYSPSNKSEVKTPLEQEEKEKLFFSSIGKDIQTKLQNIKETNKTPLEQGKEINILYRGKPKIITIINKYTKNDKEYAVITDHTDNDKTKTLFTSYIELIN